MDSLLTKNTLIGAGLGIAVTLGLCNTLKGCCPLGKKKPQCPNKKDGSTEILTVCITGAAGQIGQSVIPLILSGQCFGHHTKINLRLIDLPHSEKNLKGIALELQDCAYPLLNSIKTGSDTNELFSQADIVLFIGGFPRQVGMSRGDLLKINGDIFKKQGVSLNEFAKKTVKCLVVANPANTNCMILAEAAPSIPKKNFTALTRLDHNRTIAQIAEKLGSSVTTIKNIIIWGNHSETQYPDISHGTVNGIPISLEVKDKVYLEAELVERVQNRGKEIIAAKKSSSVMSAANAIKDHLHQWYFGTKPGEFVSMGVYNEKTANYGVPEGIVFSFPVTCKDFEYTIVQGLQISEFSQGKLNKTTEELLAEKAEAYAPEKKEESMDGMFD